MIRFLNARKHRIISNERRPDQAAVRVYDRQADFARGVRAMQRQGWMLTTFHQAQPADRMDLIRASAPGLLPPEVRRQIVAHYACARAQATVPSRTNYPRQRLARALVQVAQRLDCSAVAQDTDSTCANPA